MTPSMHRRVRDFFVESGLTDGFKTQMLRWRDSGKLTDQFMVFRPNGGDDIQKDLGGDYIILVDVIGAAKEDEDVDEAVQSIVSYIQQNPMPNECIGHIQNFGGIPQPIPTTEDRLVYRLQFVITYGE